MLFSWAAAAQDFSPPGIPDDYREAQTLIDNVRRSNLGRDAKDVLAVKYAGLDAQFRAVWLPVKEGHDKLRSIAEAMKADAAALANERRSMEAQRPPPDVAYTAAGAAFNAQVNAHNARVREATERRARELDQAMAELTDRESRLKTWLAGPALREFKSEAQAALEGRASVASAGVAAPRFSLTRVEARGEFYILTSDGRKLIGQNAAQVPIDNGAILKTGANGRVRITLPDDTLFTMGPNGEMALDEFVYDPSTDRGKFGARVVIGVFRFVTGKIAHQPYNMKVTLPVGNLGFRGTDVECAAASDGSGYVKMHSGQVVLTPSNGTAAVTLSSGQMVSINGSSIGNPTRFQ